MAYGLTKSLDLESSSSQYARRTSSLTGFWTGSGNKTIEGWAKFESLPSGGGQMMIGDFGQDADPGGNNGEFNLTIREISGNYRFMCDVYNRAVYSDVNLTLSVDTWYHFAVTYDGTNFKWYHDTTLIDTEAAGTITTPSSPVVGVGARTINSAYGAFFDGKVSLVRFWAEARSQSNLSANKCNVLGSTTNLAAEYTLDDVYTDNSGNGNTLTSSGSPVFATDVPSVCSATTYNETYTETMTLVDTVPRTVERTLSDVVTLVDTIVRSIERTISDAVTMVDTFLGERVIPAILTETMVLTDSITRSIERTLSDVVTVVDTIPRTIEKIFSEVVTAVDTIIQNQVLGRTLEETISVRDNVYNERNGWPAIWTQVSKDESTWTEDPPDSTGGIWSS